MWTWITSKSFARFESASRRRAKRPALLESPLANRVTSGPTSTSSSPLCAAVEFGRHALSQRSNLGDRMLSLQTKRETASSGFYS
jgi:hypothetical protein